MNIKNNKRYKISSEKIETTFLALILNHKYENITISQICEHANINRSTFYAHYDDINDLIIKIEGKFAKGMASIFNFGLRQTHEAFIEMFTFVMQNKYFYKAFLSIPYQTLAETSTKTHVLTNIKENSSKSVDDIDLFYRASFFGAGIKELCRLWLERDCKESPEEMAQLLYKEYSNRTWLNIFFGVVTINEFICSQYLYKFNKKDANIFNLRIFISPCLANSLPIHQKI